MWCSKHERVDVGGSLGTVLFLIGDNILLLRVSTLSLIPVEKVAQ